jgi:hypothetical protein
MREHRETSATDNRRGRRPHARTTAGRELTPHASSLAVACADANQQAGYV